MKTAGIICEYNPFHNGHLYHISKTREYADNIICVMSGNFVQRGGPAFCDKFSRAKTAVLSGADLVIELPAVFASRSAEYFAMGGVSVLNAMNIVDLLSYGSETETTVMFEETEKYREALSGFLDSGISFPSARASAAKKVFGIDIPSSPNDILAFEYNKAIRNLSSCITPLPIKREFQDYHSMIPENEYASATYIRQNPDTAEKYMPRSAYEALTSANKADFSVYESIVLAHLRTIPPSRLSETADCNEGLENRIISSAIKASSYDQLIDMIKTKRYTRGRIERIIANSLLGIDKDAYTPEYIRVLAMNQNGMKLLKKIGESCSLPVITNLSKQQIDSKQLDIDIRAGNLYSLLTCNKSGGLDFTTTPCVIK